MIEDWERIERQEAVEAEQERHLAITRMLEEEMAQLEWQHRMERRIMIGLAIVAVLSAFLGILS